MSTPEHAAHPAHSNIAFSKIAQKIRHILPSFLWVVVGNFLYALTVKLFLLPSGLVTGGTTGIALTMNHFFGIEISGFVLIFNVVMLVL